ncbi:MAG: hypothetical protein Q9174_003072 [Haloplaca sp. 1 TL-2023]
MVGVLSTALYGMLATAVVASPVNIKRQSDGDVFVFRSDLREGDGQSSEFKGLLLSVASNAITFIPQDQKDNAAGGKVNGNEGVTLTTNTSGVVNVKTMTLGYDQANPSGPQPVSLADAPNGIGEFVLNGNELRITPGSTTPIQENPSGEINGGSGNSTNATNGESGNASFQEQSDGGDPIGSDICGNGGCKSVEEFCAAVQRNGQTSDKCA